MTEAEKNNLENCQEDDVLRFEKEVCMITNLEEQLHNFFRNSSMSLTDHLKIELKITNPVRDHHINYEEWFNSGKECELLQEGKRWKKGKIMLEVKLKFIPDEPQVSKENDHHEVENITESPLDEIRQQLTEESKS